MAHLATLDVSLLLIWTECGPNSVLDVPPEPPAGVGNDDVRGQSS